jgi:C-8 sterol isomerase
LFPILYTISTHKQAVGFTGRFLAEDYFIILTGEQWAYSEGSMEREVFKAGDMHVLPRGEGQGYRMPDRCYALEYARGWIPLMLPFGVADVFSSTLDFATLTSTISLYSRLVLRELLQGKL